MENKKNQTDDIKNEKLNHEELNHEKLNHVKSHNIITLIELIKKKFMTREVITYLVAGVLTTILNIIAAYITYVFFGIEELVSNTIAWVIAVAFAYIINSTWVFKSRFISAGDELNKVLKFVSGRIASFIVEQAGILIFVKLLDINFMLVKAALAVIVIILNYIISKLFVFTKKAQE